MPKTVGELLVSTLADIGATQVFGVVGDALNPFTDALQSCGGAGFRVTQPDQLRETVSRALATAGPVVVDVAVDPNELPAMPHIGIEQVWKFGIGKVREIIRH